MSKYFLLLGSKFNANYKQGFISVLKFYNGRPKHGNGKRSFEESRSN